MDKRRIPQLTNEYSTFRINSYGAIVYSKDEKNVLIVQRKHSYGYLLILRGMYRPSYLFYYLPHLHSNELENIRNIIRYGDEILEKIYHELDLNFYNFNFTLAMFINCKEIYEQLLPQLSGKELSWTFPKGHNNTFETINDTIEREFKEEVGMDIPAYDHVSLKIIEDVNNSLFNCTMYNYYVLYVIPKTLPLPTIIDNIEVQNSKWIPITEINEYNLLNNKALYELQSLITQYET